MKSISITKDDSIAKSMHGKPNESCSKDPSSKNEESKEQTTTTTTTPSTLVGFRRRTIETIAAEQTQTQLHSLVQGSIFFIQNPEQDLPVFRHEELSIGQMIGGGEFGVVSNADAILDTFGTFGESIEDSIIHQENTHQVIKETLKTYLRRQKSNASTADDFPSGDTCDLRTYMMERCHRGVTPRFAVKRIRSDLPPGVTCVAIPDLAKEARFLASLHHSNVIRLRGTVGTPGAKDFCIILDRLYMILDQKVQEWKEDDKENRFMHFFVRDRRSHRASMNERLMAMFDIARALKYLHSHNIIFRDLKPENVGCDVRGHYKMFDFGLAKELKKEDMVNDDAYKATGLTGSRRWMAPEVCLCKPYGLSSDVFSYCLLFWHVLSLKLPFKSYQTSQHMRRVVIDGERPNPLKMRVSSFLRNVITEGLSANITERPKMTRIAEVLQIELLGMHLDGSKKGTNIFDRSVYLMDQSIDSFISASISGSRRAKDLEWSRKGMDTKNDSADDGEGQTLHTNNSS